MALKGVASDRIVLLSAEIPPNTTTGQTIRPKNLWMLLFLNEPCPLNIDGAEKMKRAWSNQGAYQVGCWFPTASDQMVVFDGRAKAQLIRMSQDLLPVARLNPDKSFTVLEKDYNSDTFLKDRLNRKTGDVLKHLHDAP